MANETYHDLFSNQAYLNLFANDAFRELQANDLFRVIAHDVSLSDVFLNEASHAEM
jgi:hypothetical protein